MAKQKINTDTHVEEGQTASTGMQDATSQETRETIVETAALEVSQKAVQGTAPEDKEGKEPLSGTEKPAERTAAASEERTPFIDDILKSHPSCETLYVDSHGGCYTAGTPACIRGKAVLYKNPHYKP